MAEGAVITTETLELARVQQRRRLKELLQIKAELEDIKKTSKIEEMDLKWIRDISATLEGDKSTYTSVANLLADREPSEEKRETDEPIAAAYKKEMATVLNLCTYCNSMKLIFNSSMELVDSMNDIDTLLKEDSSRNFTETIKELKCDSSQLKKFLIESPVPRTHKIRKDAKETMLRASTLVVKLSKPMPADVKPEISTHDDTLGNMKMTPFNPPMFSGEQKDWTGFWSEFKPIHDTTHYTPSNKLSYLRQAQKDPVLRRQIGANIDNGDAYEDVIAGLREQYDRPRAMHKIYVNQLLEMGPIKPYKTSINSCLSTIKTTWDGLTRLGQCDASSIFTTFLEGLLPKDLKSKWEDETIKMKVVPELDQLVAFLKERSTQDQYADKGPPTPSYSEKKYPSKNKSSGIGSKGSVHVATSQPQQSSPAVAEPKAPKPAAQSKNMSNKSKPSLYPCIQSAVRHTMLTTVTSSRKEKTTSQRKEFVRVHSLCQKCLKPGHRVQECRNRNSCRVCEGEHHFLIHTTDRSNSNVPAAAGTVNHTSVTSSDNSFNRNKLMMTCEAVATGPTGKSMQVRALLDSGADVSSITTKVAAHLNLKKLNTTVAIATFGSNQEQVCSATNFTLSSLSRKDWSHQVSAVIIDHITDEHPKQDASQVKEMPAVKGLTPADPNFHRPGRIDVLLGADVLPYIQTRSGPESSIIAVETVFGHAFMGTYQSAGSEQPTKATIQVAISQPSPSQEDQLSSALTRFWEMEEPPSQKPAFTIEEKIVQAEYALTHSYDPIAEKYTVVLPRKPEELKLGESRSRALQRFHQAEKSLLRKGIWSTFQQVVQEYLDLDHARLCTPAELLLPPSESYHLPMHSVVKASSTTTKVRVVFDASAPTVSGLSLNDILAVGPMLHPNLDQILLRFRSYRVALSGDISKMYREILLSPSDQQFHRFMWRPQVDQEVKTYCMKRVTFGVVSSPYLAVQTLQQTATDHGQDYPVAQYHVHNSFYVDDLLGGADTVEGAVALQSQLSEVLTKGGFTLRKFRSSSAEVLSKIPTELVEPMPSKELVDCHATSYPKALGVSWNSVRDTMSTDVLTQGTFSPTKRGILSDISKTFDVLGWIAPVILPMKMLLQELWKLKVDWDDPLQEPLRVSHQIWRDELPLLADLELSR